MGHKVNPVIFRLGFCETWRSRWFSPKHNYRATLQKDILMRRALQKELKDAAVSKIEIERSANQLTIIVHTAKPGVIIGRGGAGIAKLTATARELAGTDVKDVKINVQEVERAGLEAALAVQAIAADLERRLPFQRAIRGAAERVMRAGAQGVKVMVKGRLNGSEYARQEVAVEGKIPLHTLRADISYSRGAAWTTYGAIGVKVWIYRGELFSRGSNANES
jgi:small subunit ribosomal protein S3